MKLSDVIGYQNHGDYFEYGNHLIKVFHENEPETLAIDEFNTLKALKPIFKLVPEVIAMKVVDMHNGFLLEKIEGMSLLYMMENEPSRMFDFAHIFANTHKLIHQVVPVGLKTEAEYFASIIKEAEISDELRLSLTDLVGKVNHPVLCHGTFQPDKIIIEEEQKHLIDFERAYIGNPISDIAMTEIILASPRVPEGASEFLIDQIEKSRATFLNIYKSEYPVASANYKLYLKLAALVRLKDNLPGEKDWLLSIINDEK
ncbi:MAG: aminoglycoside phosphotransferase family protein [Clostridia bacterium]|nr:aminoglycoside phosphotransferase family protein [Clostridia bacterium]